ncbi:MAG: GNAT family N-acetyltransferase [Erythrobacter sp.]
MYESRIAADEVMVAASNGFAPVIDALAARNLSGHGFLRAAWYGAGQSHPGRTLVVKRKNGTPLAAIPTVPFGPAIAGARKVPGCYWPFRSVLISPDCNVLELAQGLERAGTSGLGRVWRLGPTRRDDPATTILVEAAQIAGWTVLSRAAGTSWVVDLDNARAQGWPRESTAKRLAKAERRLASVGTVGWRYVRGDDWSDAVLDQLAAVEAASWIARETDGSGAKFMAPHQRALWRDACADPVLAANLCATMVTLDGRPVSFSLDLDDGPIRYGIAGSYMSDLGKYEIGKLANYRAVSDAIAAGQSVVDLGAGDSGYKRCMGARPGYQMRDLLFVRSRIAARLLQRVWGKAPQQDPAGLVVPLEACHG